MLRRILRPSLYSVGMSRSINDVCCLENPMGGGAWWAAVHGVTKSRTWLSDFTFTFHFHALEKEMATHSSVLAWRIPGTGEPGGAQSWTRLKWLSSSSSHWGSRGVDRMGTAFRLLICWSLLYTFNAFTYNRAHGSSCYPGLSCVFFFFTLANFSEIFQMFKWKYKESTKF